MDIIQHISAQLNLQFDQVAATVKLLDDGNTLPFVARYRKEVTGNLDEEQIRAVQNSLESLRLLEDRRKTVLASVAEQGKLTPDLEKRILAALTRSALEDLYLPFKPKRRTRASIARDKGLDPLASQILTQAHSKSPLSMLVKPYLNENVQNEDEALAGARDIAAETISEHPHVRQILREKTLKWGMLQCRKIPEADDSRRVYDLYYDYNVKVDSLRPHQVLAIHRGETEKILRVNLAILERDWQGAIGSVFQPDRYSPFAAQLLLAIQDSAERLLLPAIERDVRQILKEKAETHAISVFATNLRALLFQPPITGHTILGIDPGFRTGSKIAVVDPTGKVLDTGTIYPHEPQRKWTEALKCLEGLIQKYRVTVIAIGNGTASRETEKLAAELIKEHSDVRYLITNEAGASVYSASPLARKELPDLDVSIRGAVSIARRVQDPLAELVKIDPKSIGVGLYQHDVDQTQLEKSLTQVVESVVNQVGVEINTASPALLTYVAGIGPKLAESIVAYREVHGPFPDRMSIKKVPRLGEKAFEQSAGFLRIQSGREPLDASAIHPESYPVARSVLKLAQADLKDSIPDRQAALEILLQNKPVERLAEELKTGIPTLKDILEQLVRPGRDPRMELPVPILRSDVLSMEDLKIGMQLRGTVRNVVDFGAFVDIGVKQDGLLHRSQLLPGVNLSVGDVIQVEVIKLEIERGRVSLKLVR